MLFTFFKIEYFGEIVKTIFLFSITNNRNTYFLVFQSICTFHFYHLQGLAKKKERDNILSHFKICIFQERGKHFQGNEFFYKNRRFPFIIILHFAVEFIKKLFASSVILQITPDLVDT